MRHGRKIARRGVRFAADSCVKEAADQQKEEQHHGGIEIGLFTTAQCLGYADTECNYECQRNWHVHVRVAVFQHAPG